MQLLPSRKQNISVTEINQIVKFSEIVTVCSANHMKNKQTNSRMHAHAHTYTVCAPYVVFRNDAVSDTCWHHCSLKG
jgi:hypothetical protein